MKKLITILALTPLCALAQGVHHTNTVFTRGNGVAANVVPYASVRVCTANTGCSALVAIYLDAALTQTARNPVLADAMGNYSYYSATACVDEQYSSPGQGLVTRQNICGSNGSSGGASFPVTSNIVVNTSTVASRNATAADIGNLLTSGATGCSSGMVYSPFSNSCVTSTGATFPSTSNIVVNTSTTASRNATSSDIGTVLSGASGCTSGKVYSPFSNSCVTISAAGVSTVNSLSGAVTLTAGSNMTITPSGNTLTFASTGGGFADPGANGLIYRAALNTYTLATPANITAAMTDPTKNSAWGFTAGTGGDASVPAPLALVDYLAFKGGVIQLSHNGGAYSPLTGTSIAENIGLVVDGGGVAITTGSKGFISVPYNCTIQSVTIIADQSGSAVVDIWKTTFANYQPGVHPVVADSITASDKPTLSGSYKSTDSTLTGWTTSVLAGDILQFNVNSASTVTRLVLLLKVVRN